MWLLLAWEKRLIELCKEWLQEKHEKNLLERIVSLNRYLGYGPFTMEETYTMNTNTYDNDIITNKIKKYLILQEKVV